MKRSFWRKLFGYRYYLNNRSCEVHDLKNPHENCKTHLIADGEYITGRRFRREYKEGYIDGCRWCLKDYNNG